MNFPSDLLYTKDHEWVRIEGSVATIGVSDHAQSELGDIVYIEIETVGETLNQHDIFGTIDAVKTASDLYMPVSGKVIEANKALADHPELVNQDPYGKGWMIKVEVKEKGLDLMDAETYKKTLNH